MKTILQSSKSPFKRSGSDLSVKTCSNHQLNWEAFGNLGKLFDEGR